ncbi:MAG TPA: hypothetical protein DEA90_06815, partial [Opitutae bacterium]|nr:hypothetical protein [Opitutae bacterium]
MEMSDCKHNDMSLLAARRDEGSGCPLGGLTNKFDPEDGANGIGLWMRKAAKDLYILRSTPSRLPICSRAYGWPGGFFSIESSV